jgi:hypothetical protein
VIGRTLSKYGGSNRTWKYGREYFSFPKKVVDLIVSNRALLSSWMNINVFHCDLLLSTAKGSFGMFSHSRFDRG